MKMKWPLIKAPQKLRMLSPEKLSLATVHYAPHDGDVHMAAPKKKLYPDMPLNYSCKGKGRVWQQKANQPKATTTTTTTTTTSPILPGNTHNSRIAGLFQTLGFGISGLKLGRYCLEELESRYQHVNIGRMDCMVSGSSSNPCVNTRLPVSGN